MSRSYKKAIIKCCGSPDFKYIFNRCIRRNDDVPDGKTYKKMNNTWSIADYIFDMRFNKEKSSWLNKGKVFKLDGKNQYWRMRK